MVSALYNSGKTVPRQAKMAMVVTIIVSFAATHLDTAIFALIEPYWEVDNENPVVFTSKLDRPAGVGNVFKGWSTSIELGEDIINDSMKEMIINPTAFPDMSQNLEFEPRLTDYEIDYQNPGIILKGSQSNDAVLTKGDEEYKILVYNTPGRPDYSNFIPSVDRWSIASPALPDLANNPPKPLRVELLRGTDNCAVSETNPLKIDAMTESGVVSLPTTITVKCISSDTRISVLSITTVRFVSSSANLWATAESIFSEKGDELFETMEKSINKPDASKSIFTEVRANKSSVEIATCMKMELKPMLCLYSSVKGHTPKDRINTWVFPSIETLREDTDKVSEYMAKLGQNFYTDEDSQTLYMLYNPEREGVRIPKWLMYSTIVVMTICLCFWVLIVILLRNSNTGGSLYKNISRQLASKTGIVGTSIMRSTLDPITIEGILLIHGEDGPTIEKERLDCKVDDEKVA
ncbi:hypothetical protein BGZ65_008026 [Modicella reniformis]|uniref:Uncharacterized protein n=1 Tax=Modicella reniformis TaxID=1440133 RepID=A0A9P6IL52_9FUNG|nr:hypothetical protein BGZ65_008026 [Modicella reniformis]